MDAFYFARDNNAAGNGYSVIKFGDTRSNSANESNYRGQVDTYQVHGNSSRSSAGKTIESNLMSDLVDRGYAQRIGNTESYIVKESMADRIQAHVYQKVDPGVVTHTQIDSLANTRIRDNDDYRVHGNAKGKPF
jgi:hypothetical protein